MGGVANKPATPTPSKRMTTPLKAGLIPSPKRRKLSTVDKDEAEVAKREKGLSTDAHSSEHEIQAAQLTKQPFNIWCGKDEPDADLSTSALSTTADTGVVPRGGNVHSVPGRLTGRGTTVAILDSGINAAHLAFKKESVQYKIDQHSRNFVGEDVMDLTDILGHGTQCAGLLCGSEDSITLSPTESVSFHGIAPYTKVMVCKVVHDGTEIANIEAVCNAIDYIREYNESCAAKGCMDSKVDVILLSFGMDYFHHKLTSKIQEALYDNIIVVCAASNNGKKIRTPITYPARLGDVLCVGACTANGKPADFSPVGRELDFLANGETLWAPTVGGENLYSCVNGTSFAAPLVAALVCWVIEDLRRLSELAAGNANGGEVLCERMHNVWCMRELLKEMTTGEHHRESGYGMLRPNEYFDKDDREKLRIITKILGL